MTPKMPTRTGWSRATTVRARDLLRWLAFAAVLLLPQAARPSPPAGPEGSNEVLADADAEAAFEASLEASGAVVGDIVVIVDDVFDSEDPRAIRWANRLHRSTREGVILRQLAIVPGDRYETRLLRESERILRASGFFRDVRIHPVRQRDNLVDLEVEVRDGWTLGGGVSYGREGGADSSTVSLHDRNFLGTGLTVQVHHARTVDRTSDRLRFFGRSLGRHHLSLETIYADNSDGTDQYLGFGRPFFSLDSRWSAGITGLESDRIDTRYDQGEIVDRFRHQERRAEISGGLSRGIRDGVTRRWKLGLTWEEDRFGDAIGFDPAELLPGDRTFVYPWVGFELIQDAYVEATKLDQMDRIEDRQVGRQFSFQVGPAFHGLGSDSDRILFQGHLSIGRQVRATKLFGFVASTHGRWGSQGLEDFRVGAAATYHWRDFGRHVFYAALSGDVAENLDHDRQLLLGGDSGLRGFPLRYQDGDRRFLATLEQRFFTGKQIFRLAELGFAVFVDVGRAWFSGGEADGKPGRGILLDAGVGLRLALTRAGEPRMIHVDFAVPYGGDPSIDSFQVLVKTKERF